MLYHRIFSFLLFLVQYAALQTDIFQAECHNETVLYEYRHVNDAEFVVIGTAGVRAFNEEDPNGCRQNYACNGIIRRETFYYGAEQFTVHTRISISTLFIDHCYAEFYMQRILSSIFHTKDGTVTLYDHNCTKHTLKAAQFRLIISDLSSAITNIMAPFSRLLQAPQLSWGGAANWFDDEEKYPLLLRYLASNRNEAHFIIQVCKRLKVDKIVLLYAETDYGLSGAQRIREEAEAACICIKNEHKITRNITKAELKKISVDAWEDKELKIVVWMGEEGYIMKLINDLPPREGMKKIFVSGLTWVPATYPGSSVEKLGDGYKCMTNRDEPEHIEKLVNWYKKVKGTVSVGMPIHSNPFNGQLCSRFNDSQDATEICKKTKVETTDGFIINMMKAWKTAWDVLKSNKELSRRENYRDFFRLMKTTGDSFYNNHAPPDYDIYIITCDREKPVMVALDDAYIRANELQIPTNCYTFELASCVDWIKENEMCSDKGSTCSLEENLEAKVTAWGIVAIAAVLFLIFITMVGFLCFAICSSKREGKLERPPRKEGAELCHDNRGFRRDSQEEIEEGAELCRDNRSFRRDSRGEIEGEVSTITRRNTMGSRLPDRSNIRQRVHSQSYNSDYGTGTSSNGSLNGSRLVETPYQSVVDGGRQIVERFISSSGGEQVGGHSGRISTNFTSDLLSTYNPSSSFPSPARSLRLNSLSTGNPSATTSRTSSMRSRNSETIGNLEDQP